MNKKLTMDLMHINEKSNYLLAVSGGVDSMVMSDIFLQKKIKFSIVHCNFSLRNEESDLDEQLVSEWCTLNKVSFFHKKFDTIKFAEDNKLSIQEAARTLRYQFFNQLKLAHSFDWIVTAHHQDDNIETMLFHFFRGTGIQGLTGIPQQENGILRPLLNISRLEIEQYAKRYNIPFRNDSSNETTKYTRNRIRHQIIPLLEETIPGLKKNMISNLKRFQEVNQIYQGEIAKLRSKFIEQRGNDWYIPIRKLKYANPLPTILFELLKPFNFSTSQLDEVTKLMQSIAGTWIESQTHRLIKDRNFLIVTNLKAADADMILIDAETTQINTDSFKLSINHIIEAPIEFPRTAMEVFICADNIEFPLILRKWRVGDYIYPFGMNKKKKVSRILIDAKIPLHEKEQIWLVESNKKVIWLAGLTLDNRYKVDVHTKNLIQFILTK